MKAWHFIKNDKKMKYGSNKLIEVGKKYTVDGDIKMCSWGLHGSIKAMDALTYAPGNIISWCDYGENPIIGDDKIVSNERTVIWMADAENTLREFARWSALQVIELWNAPQVVIDYLNTGDESLRDAAWAAAWAAQNERLTKMLEALRP